MVLSEKARSGNECLMMNDQEIIDFIQGPGSEENAVCISDNGHRYCHRKVGFVTVWMEYHHVGDELYVDNIYYHRIVVRED